MHPELKRLYDSAEHLEWQVRTGALPQHRAAALLAESQTVDAAGGRWVLRRTPAGFELFVARPGCAWTPAHPSGFATLHQRGPQLAKWQFRPNVRDLERARPRLPLARLSLLLAAVVSAAAAAASSAGALPPRQVAIQADGPVVLNARCAQHCGTPLAVTVIDLADDRLATEKDDVRFCVRALSDEEVTLLGAEQLPGVVRCAVQAVVNGHGR